MAHPGKLLLFYKKDCVMVTKELANLPLTAEAFTGSASLFRQLHEDQIERVGQLPKELVTLAKYDDVGFETVERLFRQLKEKQEEGGGRQPAMGEG